MALGTWLAKDCLDVGLFTNQLEPMLDFWGGKVGLTFDHMLPLGGGVRQHRHLHGEGVFKLNHARDPLPPGEPGGYLGLLIARKGLRSPIDLEDPDGNKVRLVPDTWEGLTHWAIEVATPDAETFYRFYERQLGLPRDPSLPLAVRCGRSQIIGRLCPDTALAAPHDIMRRVGFRYTTIQVKAVDRVHKRVVDAGGCEGAPPQTLGQTARISFVRDGCGNWMELSQRASITGSLEVI
jgi:lactoylglutathione lyase